jgi:hypothetical protein
MATTTRSSINVKLLLIIISSKKKEGFSLLFIYNYNSFNYSFRIEALTYLLPPVSVPILVLSVIEFPENHIRVSPIAPLPFAYLVAVADLLYGFFQPSFAKCLLKLLANCDAVLVQATLESDVVEFVFNFILDEPDEHLAM